MTPISFQFTLAENELAQGYRLLLKKQIWLGRITLMATLLIVTALVLYIQNWRVSRAALVPLIPMYVISAFGFWRTFNMHRRVTRRLYNQSRTIQSPTDVVVDDSGVAFNTHYLTSHSRWERFSHWGETKLLILLFDGRTAMMFPKSAVASGDDLKAFRDACAQRVRHQTYRPPLRAFAVDPAQAPAPEPADAR